jgi:hypothetical protein
MKQATFLPLVSAVLWAWITVVQWHVYGFTFMTNLSVLNLLLQLAMAVQASWVQ